MEKPYEPAKFRVCLVSEVGGVITYKKTLHRCNTKETIFFNFTRIKEANKAVLFPKRFINSLGIKTVKYFIVVTKVRQDGDKQRLVRDEYGKLHPEALLGDWVILDKCPYEIEESFYIFGLPAKANRPNISEVIKRLVAGAHKKNMVKQVVVFKNKLLIHNEDQFDMVICKCPIDALRLHDVLRKISRKQKIKSLIFMGMASEATSHRLLILIREKTGWAVKKIWRPSTRP